MIRFISTEAHSANSFTHIFECGNDEELASAVKIIMLNKGYQLVEGSINNGAYEKGNRVMRLLFGAMVKYYKFNIVVAENKVKLSSGSSGFSGGLIGVNQMQKETSQISELIKAIK
jgi:hypothetical protein